MVTHKEYIANICELYANGWTVSSIARFFKKSPRTIHTHLDKHYRMKFKNPMIMVVESKINEE